jgi:fructose-1,6-bisphosphatase II
MMMEAPDRNLALDLVRVTEAAALACGRWLGRGDRTNADKAAVDAMRLSFNSLNVDGRVVVGEGEKDEAPMLYIGEKLGTGNGPAYDVAVDPLEGTNLLAYGRPNAISTVGVAPAGTMYDPGPSHYMEKLVVPQAAKDAINLEAPVKDNLQKIAKALDKDVEDLVVFVLDKPRHETLIAKIRETGARIELHGEGDVAGALMAADPFYPVDVLMGTGGTPEGVLSACAIRAIGGQILGRLNPQSKREEQSLMEAGRDTRQIMTIDDLLKSDDVFFAATGISGGTFLDGVKYSGRGAATYSLALRGKTGTVRHIDAKHSWDKLMRFSAVKYV